MNLVCGLAHERVRGSVVEKGKIGNPECWTLMGDLKFSHCPLFVMNEWSLSSAFSIERQFDLSKEKIVWKPSLYIWKCLLQFTFNSLLLTCRFRDKAFLQRSSLIQRDLSRTKKDWINISFWATVHLPLNPTLTLTCYQLTVVELGER